MIGIGPLHHLAAHAVAVTALGRLPAPGGGGIGAPGAAPCGSATHPAAHGAISDWSRKPS